MDREVTLVIKLDDKDVVKGEVSLARLRAEAEKTQDKLIISTPAGSVMGGQKATESEEQQKRLAAWMSRTMPQASKEATTAIDGVTASTSEMSAGLGAASISGYGMVAAAGAIVLALAAVVMITVGVAAGVTHLAKSFADYVTEADKGTEATGLAANSVIALRHEADAGKTDFNQFEGAMAAFRKTVGEAAAGSDDARKKLALFGLDGKASINDIEGAFAKAIATIVQAPTEVDKFRLSIAAFGDDGYKILPFLEGFHGNLDAIKKRAAELSIELGGKDAQQTREFNRALADAKSAAEGVKLAFGRDFLDTVTSTLKGFTAWLIENKGTIKSWAEDSTSVVNKFLTVMQRTGELMGWIGNKMKDMGNTVMPSWMGSGGGTSQFMSPLQPEQPNLIPGQTQVPGAMDPAAMQAMIAQEEKNREEREKRIKADFEAALEIAKNYESSVTDRLSKFMAEAKDQFTQSGDIEEFKKRVTQLVSWYTQTMTEADQRTKQLEDEKAKRDNVTENQAKLLTQSQIKRAQDANDKVAEITRQTQDAINKKLEADQKKSLADEKKGIDDKIAEIRAGAQRELQLHDEVARQRIAAAQRAMEHGTGTERDYLDSAKQSQQDALNDKKAALDKELAEIRKSIIARPDLTELGKRETDVVGQIKLLKQQMLGIVDVETTEERLRTHINKLLTDDVRLIKERRDLARTSEEDQLVSSITSMQDYLANGKANDGLKIYEAHLRDVVADRDAELQAVIAIQHAQFELNKAMEVNNTEVRAGIYEHMAAQQTLQQGVIDGWNETYDAINKVINGPLEKLNEKTKGFLAFIIKPIEAMQTQMLNKVWGGVIDAIFPGDSPIKDALKSTGNPMLDEAKKQTDYLKQIRDALGGGPAGIPGMNPTQGGGKIQNILQVIMGGGRGANGPGGTPNWNPNAGGGGPSAGMHTGDIDEDGNYVVNGNDQQGGIFAGFKSMFGPKKNMLSGKDSKAAGIMSGVGSIATMVGGMIGDTRLGRTLQYAGMGAQIGANFGPWGAAIGAGIGALVGLFGHRDDAINKLRSAVQATYGITIKDNSILHALKQIGEAYFGKGQVGRNATAVVALDEARDLIMNYAQSTGQHSAKLDNMFHQDPNWSGNQFGSHFSGFGGGSGVPSVSASRYVPSVNGTIMPASPNVTQSGGDSVTPTLIASHAEAMHRVADELGRLNVKGAGVIVREGAADAAPAIAASQADHYGNDWSSRERTARQGQM